MPAPKRDITPWELTTNGARQHPGDGGPGLAEASAGREMSRILERFSSLCGHCEAPSASSSRFTHPR